MAVETPNTRAPRCHGGRLRGEDAGGCFGVPRGLTGNPSPPSSSRGYQKDADEPWWFVAPHCTGKPARCLDLAIRTAEARSSVKSDA